MEKRFFLFQSGSVLGVFAHTERHTSWKYSLVTERSAKCFSQVQPVFNDDAVAAPTAQLDEIEQTYRKNTQPTPTPTPTRPCVAHHHLSQFSSNTLLQPLRQVITFRNTYFPHPTHVLHQPTQAYLGACQISTMTEATMSCPTCITSAHWPATFSSKWCDTYGNDGAVRVRSLDGQACFVLAPHRQLFQLHYPAAITSVGPVAPVASVASEATKPDQRNDPNDHCINSIDHGGVVQLIWTRKCPQALKKVLLVAMETAAKVTRTTSGEYMLRGEDDDEQDHIEATTENTTEETNTKDVAILTELLPTSTPMKHKVSWDTAMVGLGGVDRIASESTLLCMSSDRLPLQQRVDVEWTPRATYWLYEEDTGAVIIGCLLHASNTFMTCETTTTPTKTTTNESATAWVKIYRAKALGTHITVAASAHVPNVEEAHAVRHMLTCISHCRLTKKDTKQESKQESKKEPNATAKSSVPSFSNTVKETCTTKNVGTFTMYEDGRLRGLFADRTMVKIEGDWLTCEIIRKDGIRIEAVCNNISMPDDEQYVRALLEFGTWSNMNPVERQTQIQMEQEYTSRVAGEADRIRRFLHLNQMEEYCNTRNGVERVVLPSKETIDNPFLVPPVRAVLQPPVLSENPSVWVTNGGDDQSVEQEPIPGRDVMQRYIKDTIERNKKFLEKEL